VARLGPVSGFICPDCGGTLYEIDDAAGVLHFRCRVGHAWSPESLVAEQDRAVENALWHAARVLREKAALHRRMAEAAVGRGSRRLAESSDKSAREAERSAVLIEAQLAGGSAGPGSP
jgi:two-component system chemotaxis response regulator CheB